MGGDDGNREIEDWGKSLLFNALVSSYTSKELD